MDAAVLPTALREVRRAAGRAEGPKDKRAGGPAIGFVFAFGTRGRADRRAVFCPEQAADQRKSGGPSVGPPARRSAAKKAMPTAPRAADGAAGREGRKADGTRTASTRPLADSTGGRPASERADGRVKRGENGRPKLRTARRKRRERAGRGAVVRSRPAERPAGGRAKRTGGREGHQNAKKAVGNPSAARPIRSH